MDLRKAPKDAALAPLSTKTKSNLRYQKYLTY